MLFESGKCSIAKTTCILFSASRIHCFSVRIFTFNSGLSVQKVNSDDPEFSLNFLQEDNQKQQYVLEDRHQSEVFQKYPQLDHPIIELADKFIFPRTFIPHSRFFPGCLQWNSDNPEHAVFKILNMFLPSMTLPLWFYEWSGWDKTIFLLSLIHKWW